MKTSTGTNTRIRTRPRSRTRSASDRRRVALVLAVTLLFPVGFCLPFLVSGPPSAKADTGQAAMPTPTPPGGSVRSAADRAGTGPAAAALSSIAAAGTDWPGAGANPGEFLRFCLSGCDADPDAFAEWLKSRFRQLTLPQIEAAVWALGRTRPGLAADIAAGSRNPWLCARLADAIAAGVPSGDRALLGGIMDTLRLPASARVRLTASALADHAEKDPAWALGQIRGGHASPRSQFSLIRGLARTDPQAALAASAACGLNPVGTGSVLLEIAKTQPAMALRLVDSRSDPAAGAAFLTRLLRDNPHQLGAEEAKTVAALVDRYADPSLAGPNQGTEIRADLVRNLLVEDPAAAVAQFEKVPDRHRAVLMSGVALAAAGQDWTRALDWVRTTQDDGSVSQLQLYGVFAHDWLRADPAGLEFAVLGNPRLPARNLLFERLRDHYQQQGGEAWRQWARNLPADLKAGLN